MQGEFVQIDKSVGNTCIKLTPWRTGQR